MSSNWNYAQLSRNDIACSIIKNAEEILPQPLSLDYIIEHYGLDPEEYPTETTQGAIQLVKLWFSRQVAEYTDSVYNELKKNEH